MTIQARMILVGVIAPLVIAAAGIIAILAAIPTLPVPIAVHWGIAGTPDGFGSPATGLLLLAVVVILYCAFAFVVARSNGEASTVNQRIILAIGPFVATLLAVLIAGTTVTQAGLGDARDAPSILPVLLLAFGLGIVAGAAAWFLLPESTPVSPAAPADLPVMALGAAERASWMQRAEPSRAVGSIVIGLLALVVGGGAVATAFTAPTPVFVVWVIGMLLIGVIAVSALFWKVTIDGTGLRARSVLGFPRFVIPAGEVATAAVIDVNPARDFGGWGIRWGGAKRIGVVTRAGEALEVTRTDGRALVVTVSQARRGAALLNALAQRA